MKICFTLLALFSFSTAFAGKIYQVTGPIISFNDTTIVVQKGSEKWEIDRGPATKINGDLKVGSKVTIEYTMSANLVEVKNK